MPSSQSSSEGRGSKRLKLTVRKPSNPEDDINNKPDRPKRKSAKPARYFDDLPAPPPKKTRKNSTASVASTPESALSSAPPSPTEEKPAGYSADFSAFYILDSSPEPEAKPEPRFAPKSASRPKSTLKQQPEPEPEPEPKRPTPVSTASPTPFDEESALEIDNEAPVIVDKPQVVDDPATVARKLQNACQALSGLQIPAVYVSDDELPPLKPSVPGVNSLLAAAAGDSPVEGNDYSLAYVGTPDAELADLVRDAANALRNTMVAKLAASKFQARPRGRPKRELRYGQYAIDKEKFAYNALSDLLGSSALNTNCLIQRDRARLVRTLYRQLVTLYASPHIPQFPQVAPYLVPGMAVQSLGFMPPVHQPQMNPANMPFFQPQQQGPPPPHQFLFRDNPNSYNSPYQAMPNTHPPPPPLPPAPAVDRYHAHGPNSGNFVFDKIKMYQPSTGSFPLMRSGQSMKLSFHHPQPGPPNGVPMVNGVPIPIGMANNMMLPPPNPHGIPFNMSPQPMLQHQRSQHSQSGSPPIQRTLPIGTPIPRPSETALQLPPSAKSGPKQTPEVIELDS